MNDVIYITIAGRYWLGNKRSENPQMFRSTAMKSLITASILALGLFAGTASARQPFDSIADSAPRSVFDEIRDTAPRSVFDEIRDTAPRSLFDEIRDSAPRQPFDTIADQAP
jgi:hypothetical protein